MDTQKKYLEDMKKAADLGDIPWSLLATLIDRIETRDGKKQTYGTQFHQVNGEWVPLPIEDPEHVDERRHKVGLPPLAQYAAGFKKVYGK